MFPELEFLEKPFLNLSRINTSEKKSPDNNIVTTDSNLNYIHETNNKEECIERDFERLSCSDTSDGSDFVLLDVVRTYRIILFEIMYNLYLYL